MPLACFADRAKSAAIPVVAAAAVLLAVASAAAQDNEQITIVAPHAVQHKQVGRTYTGIPIEQISLSHRVGFSDLDLTKPADVAILKKRVEAAALQGCKELDKLYPLDNLSPSNKSCANSARETAMQQVDAAVAAAVPKK